MSGRYGTEAARAGVCGSRPCRRCLSLSFAGSLRFPLTNITLQHTYCVSTTNEAMLIKLMVESRNERWTCLFKLSDLVFWSALTDFRHSVRSYSLPDPLIAAFIASLESNTVVRFALNTEHVRYDQGDSLILNSSLFNEGPVKMIYFIFGC